MPRGPGEPSRRSSSAKQAILAMPLSGNTESTCGRGKAIGAQEDYDPAAARPAGCPMAESMNSISTSLWRRESQAMRQMTEWRSRSIDGMGDEPERGRLMSMSQSACPQSGSKRDPRTSRIPLDVERLERTLDAGQNKKGRTEHNGTEPNRKAGRLPPASPGLLEYKLRNPTSRRRLAFQRRGSELVSAVLHLSSDPTLISQAAHTQAMATHSPCST